MWCEASSARRYTPRADETANGSSKSETSPGRSSRKPVENSTSWCRTPRWVASCRAQGDSSTSGWPGKLRVKLARSPAGRPAAAIAVTMLESTPPLRSEPMGTSAMSRRRMLSVRSSATRSAACVGSQRRGRRLETPVGLVADVALPDDGRMARQDLPRLAEDRERRGHLHEREVVVHRDGVEVERNIRNLAKCLELRGECDDRPGGGGEQRLDAEPVARREELALASVPDHERPHPVEPLDAVEAPLDVGVEDDLGVGAALEGVPQSLELFPELEEIVDHPVEDDPERAIQRGHRLMPRGTRDRRWRGAGARGRGPRDGRRRNRGWGDRCAGRWRCPGIAQSGRSGCRRGGSLRRPVRAGGGVATARASAARSIGAPSRFHRASIPHTERG